MADSTQYQPMRLGQSAPQVSGPGLMPRLDPRESGAGFNALANAAAGGVEYLNALQKAADLSVVAERRSLWGKRMGEEFAAFANSRAGTNPTEDMQKWGEISQRVKYETTKDVSGGAATALNGYFAQHEETFNAKAREAVYGAVKKNADLTMDNSLADKVALGMQSDDKGVREQHMLKQLEFVDAQVAAGLLSPIDGEIRKTKDRQLFYTNLFRADLLKDNWRKAYDEWQNDAPIDSQGNTWKRLVGKDGIEALERMTATVFAERTREAVRIQEKRQTDGIRDRNTAMQSETARLARTGTPEQWEAHRQRVLADPFATPETIRGVEKRPDPLDSTPEAKTAKEIVRGGYSEGAIKYNPESRAKRLEDETELLRRIQAGEKPLEAAQEIRKARAASTSRPSGFTGDATQQNLDAYEQSILGKVSRGEMKQVQADRAIAAARQWVASQQAKR